MRWGLALPGLAVALFVAAASSLAGEPDAAAELGRGRLDHSQRLLTQLRLGVGKPIERDQYVGVSGILHGRIEQSVLLRTIR